jgi:hypothetical protein
VYNPQNCQPVLSPTDGTDWLEGMDDSGWTIAGAGEGGVAKSDDTGGDICDVIGWDSGNAFWEKCFDVGGGDMTDGGTTSSGYGSTTVIHTF